MNEKYQKFYKNLEGQIKKINKHNRQCSFKTKERYYSANKRFCKFLAQEFKLQKFANISDKHIEKYIQHMREKNYAISTIKTELGAIRFFHDKCDKSKYRLSENSKWNLERRKFRNVDRAWSKNEYRRFKLVAQELGNHRVLAMTILAREQGLRIHETAKISRSDAERALKTGTLTIKGKGGKIRDIPITKSTRELLNEKIREVQRGEKLFVAEDEKTHLVIKQVQNFINRHREKWQDEEREVARTFHGLRHTYARNLYEEKLNEGKTEYQARLEVSKLLGHERDEVTKIYIAR